VPRIEGKGCKKIKNEFKLVFDEIAIAFNALNEDDII
jgi:hypothetical protein